MNKNKREQYGQRPDGSIRMKELPLSERPYEKCLRYGPEALSDSELLAVVIRTGSRGEKAVDLARKVLGSLPQKNLGGLFQVSLKQLQEIRGIGKVKAVQLKCMAEFTKRMVRCSMPLEQLKCSEPEQVAAYYCQQMRFLETEQVLLLVLDGKNAVIQEIVILMLRWHLPGKFSITRSSTEQSVFCFYTIIRQEIRRRAVRTCF